MTLQAVDGRYNRGTFTQVHKSQAVGHLTSHPIPSPTPIGSENSSPKAVAEAVPTTFPFCSLAPHPQIIRKGRNLFDMGRLLSAPRSSLPARPTSNFAFRRFQSVRPVAHNSRRRGCVSPMRASAKRHHPCARSGVRSTQKCQSLAKFACPFHMFLSSDAMRSASLQT